MNVPHAANPYNALNFDFESYEIEVERGRQRIILVLLLNMAIVITNIVANQLTLDKQTKAVETLIRVQLQAQHISNQTQLLKQMTEIFSSPLYPVQMLVSQIALYLVIAVLPWVAIYLGKSWARSLVGFFAALQGVAGVLLAPVLLWMGFYGLALFALPYGLIKLYTTGVLFMVPSVAKYFNHAKL